MNLFTDINWNHFWFDSVLCNALYNSETGFIKPQSITSWDRHTHTYVEWVRQWSCLHKRLYWQTVLQDAPLDDMTGCRWYSAEMNWHQVDQTDCCPVCSTHQTLHRTHTVVYTCTQKISLQSVSQQTSTDLLIYSTVCSDIECAETTLDQ